MNINESPDQKMGVRSIDTIIRDDIEPVNSRFKLAQKHVPTVQKHFGHSDPKDTQFLLNLIVLTFKGEEFEEALDKFTTDLIQNNPVALSVEKSVIDFLNKSRDLKEIYQRMIVHLDKEEELNDDSHQVFCDYHDFQQVLRQSVFDAPEYINARGMAAIAQDRQVVLLNAWADLYWPKNTNPSVRNTPEEVSEALTLLPNGKADRDFQHGLLLLPRAWGRNEERITRYFNGKEGHVVEYQPSEIEKSLGDAPDRALTALDERFAKIKSETVADVIDILFHHWHTTKDSHTNAATINAAKLCEYRNKTLSGENLELHWHALKDAFSFTLRETSSDLKARIFFSESQGENTEGPGAKYIYSPGFMLQYALKGQPLYFAPFLQKVWALDPIRENEAKRLARYLRADWRMNTQDYLTAESGGARAARWHTWEYLLSEAGIDVESIKKKANKNRLIETMKRAVETLYQMGVIADGDFHIYHPDDRQTAENLPARGALDVWLTLSVCLGPSAALREALLETDSKRRAGRARDAKALATEKAKKQLRAQRKAKPQTSK